jgi:hypothetical protein
MKKRSKRVGRDVGHEFVRAALALPAVEAQREK